MTGTMSCFVIGDVSCFTAARRRLIWHKQRKTKVICNNIYIYLINNTITRLLTFMVQWIARCVFYISNEMQLIQCSTCFGRFFRPSSGAYKTVFAAFGIVILSCCTPLLWVGCSNPSTPVVYSRKAWQYPRLHIQIYKRLMMGGKPARNM
jgi:hypothetical protein